MYFISLMILLTSVCNGQVSQSGIDTSTKTDIATTISPITDDITVDVSTKTDQTAETDFKSGAISESATISTTPMTPSTCTSNGRFRDPSDPSGQSYVLCSWNGIEFQMWKLECPSGLVFNEVISKCGKSGNPVTTTTTTEPTTRTASYFSSVRATCTPDKSNKCTKNGRFIAMDGTDPTKPCLQWYLLCSYNGTGFNYWVLKCPNNLEFNEIYSKCKTPATTITTTTSTTITTTAAISTSTSGSESTT